MIRSISIKDAESLNKLCADELGYLINIEITRNQINKLIDDPHHFIRIYELDENVVGFIHAEVYESLFSNTMFNILGIAVNRNLHGRGIGKELLKSLENEARLRSFEGIRFNSGLERKEAHLFYESFGFVSNKLQKRYLKVL
ncbi:GNAT family N-acetyltransferase [Macrococcus animalis]|uniref:GNAT family N-acetyltransferase n=1 Tax=Macrococcus animalis TaxID=3395467 RepID=UPI0039BE6904